MKVANEAPATRAEERRDKAGFVMAFLANAIAGGRFAPGQRLIEADLTSELGVSRGLLREAFRRLSAEGLIEIVRNRGALVRRLSKREALELFQIRTELEALAVRLAAGRMKDPLVRRRFECETAPVRTERPDPSAADYIAENREFHAAIFRAAGNGQLFELNRRMQLSLIMAQIRSEMPSRAIADSIEEHRIIAKRILDQDASGADRAMRAHLRRASHVMQSMSPWVFRRDEGTDAPVGAALAR